MINDVYIHDVYICIMRGGFISSVTIVDENIADNTIKQFRNAGLSVRTFRDRAKYEEFLKHDNEEYRKNTNMQKEAIL